MIADVDHPASIGTRTTFPPRASTVSRPTMASAAQSAPFTSTSGRSAIDDRLRRLVVEDDDRVDGAQRLEDLRAFVLGHDRPRRSLVRADGSVGVDRDDQHVALGARGLQVAGRGRDAAGRTRRW